MLFKPQLFLHQATDIGVLIFFKYFVFDIQNVTGL